MQIMKRIKWTTEDNEMEELPIDVLRGQLYIAATALARDVEQSGLEDDTGRETKALAESLHLTIGSIATIESIIAQGNMGCRSCGR